MYRLIYGIAGLVLFASLDGLGGICGAQLGEPYNGIAAYDNGSCMGEGCQCGITGPSVAD